MKEFAPIKPSDLFIPQLGIGRYPNPLLKITDMHYVTEGQKVLFDQDAGSLLRQVKNKKKILAVERAGPRARIYFKPERTRVAIVTCGGLCPGLNDVIRGIFMECYHRYGVRSIFGVRDGYQGLAERPGIKLLRLTSESVEALHEQGGTFLGTSRGAPPVGEMVSYLLKNRIHILFIAGGDGTMKGALDIATEAERRGAKIGVIGIPKTIDNDILYIDRTFGMATAVTEAVRAIKSAHVEAKSSLNGIGLVKLMGRHSGYVASAAAIAQPDANYVLIPENPFRLEGRKGLLEHLKWRLAAKKHAVIVVAEGAGQDLMDGAAGGMDASGNVRLKDIGLFLKERIQDFFKDQGIGVNLKYIDPSYIIRSVPAGTADRIYCLRLAQEAVHAGMSGRTKAIVGLRHGEYVHLPMDLITRGRRYLDLTGAWWRTVLSTTGQPPTFG